MYLICEKHNFMLYFCIYSMLLILLASTIYIYSFIKINTLILFMSQLATQKLNYSYIIILKKIRFIMGK